MQLGFVMVKMTALTGVTRAYVEQKVKLKIIENLHILDMKAVSLWNIISSAECN